MEKREEGKPPIIVRGFIVEKNLPSHRLIEEEIYSTFKRKLPLTHVIPKLPKKFRYKFVTHAKFWYFRLARLTIRLGYNLYLLPASNLLEFLKLKREMRERYENLEDEIAQHLAKEIEFGNLAKEAAASFGGSINLEPPHIADRFTAELVPLNLSPELYEEYVENKYLKAVKEVDETKAKMLETAKQEMAQARERMISEAVKDVDGKLNEILKKLLKAAIAEKLDRRSIKAAKRWLGDLEALCADVGVPIGPRLEAARNLTTALTTGEGMEDAARSVASVAGVAFKEPKVTIAEAAMNLFDDLSPRARALLAELSAS